MPKSFLTKVSSALTKVLPPLRSDREVAEFMRENIQPIAPTVPDEVANQPVTMLDPPGIDYRREGQLALLASFRSERHQDLFRALREDAVINKFGFGSPGVSNTFCNTPDAEIYGAMILDRRPRRSSRWAQASARSSRGRRFRSRGFDSKIVVIDPFPRTDVKAAADELNSEARRAERPGAERDWSSERSSCSSTRAISVAREAIFPICSAR